MSLYGFSTYCSPAFWPQSRSKGSVGWAGPLEEEAEEPQTLEQQHPERQRTERQRDTRAVEGWTGRQEKSVKCKKRCKRNRGGIKENKKLVSERNSAGSFAEQFMYTFPISVLLFCVFQAGLKRCSSRLGLRIDLTSICFKSEAMACSGLVQQWKSWQWWFVVRMTQQK